MDPVSASLGVVSAVIQSYTAIMATYDVCLEYRQFSSTYKDIRMCLLIERFRLEQWYSLVQPDEEDDSAISPSPQDLTIWRLFEMIFGSMLNMLEESNQKMDLLGQRSGLGTEEKDQSHELIDNLALSAENKTKLKKSGALRRLKFILRDESRMRSLITHLSYLNDSLEKLNPQLERERQRRQLRTHFASLDVSKLGEVRNAATLLKHHDIQNLAIARLLVEDAPNLEVTEKYPESPISDGETSLQLNSKDVKISGSYYATEQPRAVGIYKDQEVIIDWRESEDDAWRTKKPEDFQKRTENLTRVLNRDLKPLNLSILHCVGYLNQGRAVTGYAFRLPDHAWNASSHCTLFDLVSKERDPRELPDLGERFELAKALVRTVFGIQSINWLHKNISPKNILFWSRKEHSMDPDITRPYLMGFDTARPNKDSETSERVARRADDDHYRHPNYRKLLDTEQLSSAHHKQMSRPYFDIFSLGVVLYEIGIWHNLSHTMRPRAGDGQFMRELNTDPLLVQKRLDPRHIKELKRHTGHRYANVVVACLDHDLDKIWEELSVDEDRSIRLQQYLQHVQHKIVEPLALCCA